MSFWSIDRKQVWEYLKKEQTLEDFIFWCTIFLAIASVAVGLVYPRFYTVVVLLFYTVASPLYARWRMTHEEMKIFVFFWLIPLVFGFWMVKHQEQIRLERDIKYVLEE